LLTALSRRDELGVARCNACGGVRLRDLLAKRRLACGTCESPDFNLAVEAAIECAAPC
jgi:ribosomal protein S27AE